MLLYGDPKVGKSFAALQLACDLVSGTEWLGFGVPAPTPTVYIQLDTPRSLWAARVESLQAAGHPIEAVYFADRETLDTHPFDILEPAHFARLVGALRTLTVQADSGEDVPEQPGVVIIDTLRESHSGDENDSTAMQDVIAHLDAAVKPAALVLVSHARKANPEAGFSLMNDNRGSNYIVGRMDVIVRFSPKSLRISSRTMEEHSIDTERNDDGTWSLRGDPAAVHVVDSLLADQSIPSLREKARVLSQTRVPRTSEMACRAILRRRQAALTKAIGSTTFSGHGLS